MSLYLSGVFNIKPKTIEKYGAFNISLVSDLPLFIDPFLLFNSRKPKYRQLHNSIIEYLTFLRDKSVATAEMDSGLLQAWYHFHEVEQTWLGFSASGNKGSGLGKSFANALHENLNKIFTGFGSEKLTRGSHLEKLCLIRERVGRDNISDFTTNLIKEFLLEYSQSFAQKHLEPTQRKVFTVTKVRFNYETEAWEPKAYELPCFRNEYVLLTPKDILTKDDTWINKRDLFDEFDNIPDAIPDKALRAQINNYFLKRLPRSRRDDPTKKDRDEAALKTLQQFPQLIDAFIKYKEDHGNDAESVAQARVVLSEQLYIQQFGQLVDMLERVTGFYQLAGNTYEEAHARVGFLKDVIENKGGHKIFYVNGRPIHKEEDVHVLYRLTWYSTPSDVSREVNDGRGPADFKVSRGRRDKSIVEFKLAKNSQLERNLEKQAEIYQKASDAKSAIKVIVYFSAAERGKVDRILKRLKLTGNKDVVLIDARKDNKPPASKA